MKISPSSFSQFNRDLLIGDTKKLTPKLVDDVKDVNFKGTKENHRLSYKYDKELRRNVVHIINNSTGETVKKSLSDAQIQHMIRTERLLGLYVDEES